MTYLEFFRVMSKPWANLSDIKLIASCGRDTATRIRNIIIAEIKKEGKNLPITKGKLVPMEYVIKYFDLDVNYITLMVQNENKVKL